MMGLPPPDTGGCKPKLLVLMGDIIQTNALASDALYRYRNAV